jgi:hypothetical protein
MKRPDFYFAAHPLGKELATLASRIDPERCASLNVIFPIAIGVLVVLLMGRRNGRIRN